jgi:hypothetical protein
VLQEPGQGLQERPGPAGLQGDWGRGGALGYSVVKELGQGRAL